MTTSQIRRGRWAVGMAILTTVALLFLALYAVGPQLLQDVGASYGQREYLPERSEYCPGEVLRFSYTVAPRTPGPVEIMSGWRNDSRGTSLLAETTVQHANIVRAAAAITATLSITIPVSPQMQPGSRWVFSRSVRKMGSTRFEMLTVPFAIRDDCE